MQKQTLSTWPHGKRIAVAVAVMYETWAEGKAPTYSVQTTTLKPGIEDHASKAWSTYGGRAGIWRILRILEQRRITGTFFVNARCTELYPDSVKQIIASGHEIAAHAYTQDQLLSTMSLQEQQQIIESSIGLMENFCGIKPEGWVTPALSFTPETAEYLVRAGIRWHADVTYTDLPHRIQTPYGQLVGIPISDFTDNRVLRASPVDLIDVYRNTFDYLYENEPGSMLVLGLHAHFGGRPMIAAAVEQILKYITKHDQVWFARYSELADWALAQLHAETPYHERFPFQQ